MSTQANLKKICDNGIDALASKLEEKSSELTSTHADITADWNEEFHLGLERLAALTSEAIKEFQSASSQSQSDIEMLGMESDLQACVESIEHEWSTRASISMEFIEGVRSSYRAILGEYDRFLSETLSEGDENNAANTSSSLYHLINRTSPDTKAESNELISKLNAQDKVLAQSVADKTLEALTFWHEGMSGRARVIQAAMEKNLELLSAATRGMPNTEPVATVSEKIERLKAELSKSLASAQAETEELIAQLNREAKDELKNTLSFSSEAGRKVMDNLTTAAAQQVEVIESLFEKQVKKEVEKLDWCKANLTASCDESMEALADLEEQAKAQQQLVAKELAEEANAAALLFQQNLTEVFERALRQVDAVMDQSESELRALAESIVDRFRKSTLEYMEQLDSTRVEVLDEVSIVRSDCVSMLDTYISSSEGGDD